jgi:hypothetical protein
LITNSSSHEIKSTIDENKCRTIQEKETNYFVTKQKRISLNNKKTFQYLKIEGSRKKKSQSTKWEKSRPCARPRNKKKEKNVTGF